MITMMLLSLKLLQLMTMTVTTMAHIKATMIIGMKAMRICKDNVGFDVDVVMLTMFLML